jgi:hypothetical protein
MTQPHPNPDPNSQPPVTTGPPAGQPSGQPAGQQPGQPTYMVNPATLWQPAFATGSHVAGGLPAGYVVGPVGATTAPPPAGPAPAAPPQYQQAPTYQAPAHQGQAQPGQQTQQESPPAGSGQSSGQQAQQPSVKDGNDVYHFPENTALAQMTPDQVAEYWRHKARRHEDRVKSMTDYDELKAKAAQYEQLVVASQTEHERAVAEARRQGETEALTKASGQLVEQWLRAAAVGRISEQAVNDLLGTVDRSRFLTNTGAVDTDRVFALVTSLSPVQPAAPAVPAVPVAQGQPAAQPPAVQSLQPPMLSAPPGGGLDFGQGHPGASKPSGLSAGAAIARERFGAPPSNTPTSH